MSKQVVIFLHMDDESPGYIGDYLQRQKIPHCLIRGYQGDVIPALDDSIAGLVFMGGVMSANDDIPWLKQEITLIREGITQGIPILGHCLGGQLITVALGGKVISNPVPEVGWHRCHRQLNSAAADWLGDVEDPFIMFHWHLETFSVPVGAQLLFSSEHCQHQAYSYGNNVLAIQGHVEMTESLLVSWLTQWRSYLSEQSDSEQTDDEIRQHLVANVAALNQVAERLYCRWSATLSL